MRLWHLTVTRVRSLVLRGRRDREDAEELRLHIEEEVALRIARGESPDEARRRALLAFGGVEALKEQNRDARGLALWDHLSRDSRHAARRFARDWRFTVAAVLILGLGIGVDTAMFSAVNTALFRPHPFRDSHELVNVYENFSRDGQVQENETPYPAYLDMAAYDDIFAGVTTFSVPTGVRYQADDLLRPGVAEYATSSYLEVLGLEPARGRWFTEAEDQPGGALAAVIGYDAWTAKFDAAPSVIGSTLRIDGMPVTVIGVGPRGYHSSLTPGIVTDFWLSISSVEPIGGLGPGALDRAPGGEGGFLVKARLREGIGLPQARAAMTALGSRLAREYPDEDPGAGITVLASDDVRFHPQIDSLLIPAGSLLLIIVGLLLAIACSNLATLLLVRGSSRANEVTVRLALGATRGLLVRHLLTEHLLLALGGGALGYLLAAWTVRH